MKRRIVDSEIEYWIGCNPDVYKPFFENRTIKAYCELADIITEGHNEKDEILRHFIYGIAALPLILSKPNENIEAEMNRLINPALSLIKEYLESGSLQKFILNKEISGEAYLTVGDVTIPLSINELLLHTKRTKMILTVTDVGPLIKDWIIHTRKLYAITSRTNSGNQPKFNPNYIPRIFECIKEYFNDKDQTILSEILKDGGDAPRKLVFMDNGNKLADVFKRLINAQIIIGCTKKNLESWIERNFQYTHNNRIFDYTKKFLELMISSKQVACKRPIIDIQIEKESGNYLISKAT